MSERHSKKAPPGKGLMGWLGRQVGHVKKAIQTEPVADRKSASQSPSQQDPSILYRDGRVEEAELPEQPGVKLRRTIIDEVVVDPPDKPEG